MIVSTTLVGPGTVDVLDLALESVRDQVDSCILIPTFDGGRELERELHRASVRAGVGKRYHVRRFQWCDDFSAARNYALDVAAGAGADWAVTLDTDERLAFGDVDLRARLAETDVDVWLVAQADGSYAKERIIRIASAAVRNLGNGYRWRGPTHECLPLVGGSKRATLDGVTFSELAKSPEQLREKFQRDGQILQLDLVQRPPSADNARSWFYYGESMHGLGELEPAIHAFETCATHSGWNEEAAWSRYRAADLSCRLGKFDQAIEHAALGLTKHAGIAELGWIAGIAAFRAGRFEQAIHWATLAASVGWFSGTGRWIQRGGFRYPPALWEGPYDILWHAFEALGEHEQAARNRARKAAAEKLRFRDAGAKVDDDEADSEPDAT